MGFPTNVITNIAASTNEVSINAVSTNVVFTNAIHLLQSFTSVRFRVRRIFHIIKICVMWGPSVFGADFYRSVNFRMNL